MAAGRFSSECFRYGGNLGVNLIVGGVDIKGPQLLEISGDGNCYSFPFLTMGSGCLAAMAVIETGFKEQMSEEEATALVTKAIEAGIYHDLGSGSNVDVCIIKKGKTTLTRSVKHDNFKVFSKPGGYKFPKERVNIIDEYKQKMVVEDGGAPMDLS